MDKLKILHVINNLGSGGAEKLLDDILPRLNENQNFQVELLLLTDQNNVFDSNLKKEGIKISVIKLRNPINPLNIFYIRKFIKKGNYYIVHAHLFPTLYWVSIASRLIVKNKPLFFYTEHSTFNRRRDKKYLRILERKIYYNYDKIISISYDVQINLKTWLDPKIHTLDKFEIINNGIDIDKFKSAKPYKKIEIHNKFDENTKLLCMIGRFSNAKDQSTIIKSMVDLPKNVHLLLVGEGDLIDHNKRLSCSLGVNHRVHFLGFRKDVDRIIKTSDIIIQSSNWEGYGISAVEGMAAGKPIIASNVSGLNNIVGGIGLLFTRGDSQELLNLIKKLLLDDKEYEKYSNRSVKGSYKYNIDNTVEKYLELYKIVETI